MIKLSLKIAAAIIACTAPLSARFTGFTKARNNSKQIFFLGAESVNETLSPSGFLSCLDAQIQAHLLIQYVTHQGGKTVVILAGSPAAHLERHPGVRYLQNEFATQKIDACFTQDNIDQFGAQLAAVCQVNQQAALGMMFDAFGKIRSAYDQHAKDLKDRSFHAQDLSEMIENIDASGCFTQATVTKINNLLLACQTAKIAATVAADNVIVVTPRAIDMETANITCVLGFESWGYEAVLPAGIEGHQALEEDLNKPWDL